MYVDEAFATTLGTNVNYAPAVEAKTNFISRLLVWAERRYNANFLKFFDAAYKQGIIPEVNVNEEGAPQ